MSDETVGQPQEIVVLTHFASPYQVELFDEIARLLPGSLAVYYLHGTHASRGWKRAAPRHRAYFFEDQPQIIEQARSEFRTAHLAIFNYYAEPPAAELLQVRNRSGLPWCFWGERPGFKSKILGRLWRRWGLRALHASNSPVWSIGKWAAATYQKEFGRKRHYLNLPYFSNLGRFERLERRLKNGDERIILFSGSLIPRKGVDLLANAFSVVAREYRNLKLHILGDGELRAALGQQLAPLGECVKFLGFKDWEELPSVYGSADLLCVPSRYDGWGLVVPEGLASGLPVIGTDRMGAALEFLETGRNGWLIRASDGEALENALREAANLPVEELAALSVAARDTVKEHSLQNGAQRFLEAAREAVANWRK